MMVRKAASEAAKRGLLVWIAAMVVVMIGLVVFPNHDRLPGWLWQWRVAQVVENLTQ